jgi:hypothetical protein
MRVTACCLTVAISICAWLAISNHCVISALTTKADSTQSACPFHSKPVKPQSPQSTACCKILRAVSNAPTKNLAPSIVDLSGVDLAFAKLVILAPPKIYFTSATLDTGPPGKTSFVELKRSMRAHAPPILS